jgi:hypothetical protein
MPLVVDTYQLYARLEGLSLLFAILATDILVVPVTGMFL